MSTWLFLIGAILAEVIATLSLKAALDLPVLYLVVAAGYAVTFVLLAQSLRRGMGLGVAYGIWGASGVTLTAVLAAFLFGEDLNAVMAWGSPWSPPGCSWCRPTPSGHRENRSATPTPVATPPPGHRV